MIGGFAVIAYPARYGISGIMSFLMNEDGVVYEHNLGKNTSAIASKMTTLNPDAGWEQVASVNWELAKPSSFSLRITSLGM